MTKRGSIALGALVVLSQGACSLIVEADRAQCHTNEDCTVPGGAFAGSMCVNSLCRPDTRWSCVDEPEMPSGQPGPFAVTMHTADLLTQQPRPGVQAQLCNKVDIDCSMPLFTAISDATGTLTLQ